MKTGVTSYFCLRYLKRLASCGLIILFCHCLGLWEKIWRVLQSNEAARSTAFDMPPAIDVCTPTLTSVILLFPDGFTRPSLLLIPDQAFVFHLFLHMCELIRIRTPE